MNYRIEVTDEEMGIIARALMERPYREVTALFGKLDAQIAEQQTPPAEEAPAKEEADEQRID